MDPEVENDPELEREAAELKQQIAEARQKVYDADIVEATAAIESLKLAIKVKKTLRGHLTKVYDLDWSRDSRHVVSASQDSRLLVWDTYSGNKMNAILLDCAWVTGCAFAPSGQLVASGGLDNVCSVFTLDDKEQGGVLTKVLIGHDGYMSDCVFIDDKQILTSSGDQSCILWDIKTGQQITSLKEHIGEVDCLAMHEDFNQVLSGSTDMTIKLWDLREGMANQSLVGHEGDITAVEWMPDGTCFVTASADGSTRLFDLRSDQQLAFYCLQEPSPASSVSCSPSGRVLFTGYDDFTIIVWDMLKCEQLAVLGGHDNRVSCLGVDREGISLCTGSWDSFLKTWG